MNKLKTYREYIILIAIAAVLLLYIIFRSAGNINYSLPQPDAVDAERINRITMEGQLNLEFSKTDDQWFIEPEGWQAENSNFTTIVKALADIRITDLISTSGNPGVYSLDENQRVLVKAYDGNELLREIYVGKVSNTGIYTYIMFPDDNNIYSVRGNIASKVSDKNSMRDKKFLKLNRDSVLKMTLTSPGAETVILFKDGTDVWQGDSYDADDELVKAAVNLLDPLRCKDFLYTEPSGSAAWTIEFLTTDGTVTLEIWPESDNLYPARSSQNGYFVNITPYAAERILESFGLVFGEEE